MTLTAVEIREAVKMALGALKSNKLRTGLTILGVMIGVSSVIGMASIINGMNGAVDKQIDEMGSNVIWITKFDPSADHGDQEEEDRNRPPITVSEAHVILASCPTVEGVAPQNFYFAPGGNKAKYKNKEFSRPQLFGTWPDFMRVNNKNLQSGRFFTEADENARAMVCVLGANIAATFFENEIAEGKEIRVNGKRMTVVGVLEEMKTSFGDDGFNRSIAIPLSTFEKLHPWEKELFLVARASAVINIDKAQEEIISALRIHRKVPFNAENNFALSTQQQFKDEVANFAGYIYIAMVIITSVGLMVGGIGVMNIMLVSVTERTREIGIRKAIGAKKANIILQFLTEAMTLSGAGGVIGIVFGIALGLGINALLSFPLSISLFWVVLGFVVAVSVGLVSGVYPAIKAARLDPIEALRYE